MTYPPLEKRVHLPLCLSRLERHLKPSPRLRFFVHSSIDIALAVALVLAHAHYGSSRCEASTAFHCPPHLLLPSLTFGHRLPAQDG